MVAQMPVTLGASALGAYGGGAVGSAIGGPSRRCCGATIGDGPARQSRHFLQEYGGIRQDQQEARIDDQGAQPALRTANSADRTQPAPARMSKLSA